MKKKNIMLISACIALIIVSLVLGGRAGEFSGADSQIEGVISEVNKDYQPWFESVWAPPSGEIESMLFALQAAIGAGFVGYYIGKKKKLQSKAGCRK
ncbi:cobalt transporter CbiN [Fervidicella metallireducens AeB]|uniref:Cobalt transport protein CbiN n=1 Tax=Fervidicella metallireducens AeB TaxID=1403537 RepID=A0A017RUX8_9CLOT|nr:energy-coupling factor ABC transporter substrate-binding protein [Fervidicella metallireducens]EYE88234.1 cobalt transporter CbiN [Fervidicella metallireducens AeB]